MDMQFRGLRTFIYLAIFLAGPFGLSACGDSEESTNEIDRGTSTASEGTQSNDGEAVDAAAEPEGPATDDDASDGEGSEASAGNDGSVEALLATVETAAQPLGDVIGATRAAGLEPFTTRADSYPRLCPADDLPIEAVRQEDPLVENLPVVRYVLAFPSDDEASAFFDDLVSTEVGCVSERAGEVSTATATINKIEQLDVMDDLEAVQIGASIAVDLINLDQDPPALDVVRSVALEGSAVIIVISLAEYGSVIGVADVHGPLLTDGVGLVRVAS